MTTTQLWILGLLVTLSAQEGRANLFGSDDFNDNAKNTNWWGADYNFSVGGSSRTFFTETNGRLEFATSGVSAPIVDLCARPWVRNFGSYTQHWDLRIDVNVPLLSQEVRLGFLVFPGQSASNALTHRFDVNLQNEAGGVDHWFNCRVAVNGGADTSLGSVQTTSTNAALRVAFNPDTKVLSSYYDPDGSACGRSWTHLASATVPAGWGMTSNSVFGVALHGFAVSASVASADNVFTDNFSATGDRPIPKLGISLVGENCLLSWFTNNSLCFLEFTTTLSPPICWERVTNDRFVVNTNFVVTNAVAAETRFYRLNW